MNVQYGTRDLKFVCETEDSAEACMREIKEGSYDITTFGGVSLPKPNPVAGVKSHEQWCSNLQNFSLRRQRAVPLT